MSGQVWLQFQLIDRLFLGVSCFGGSVFTGGEVLTSCVHLALYDMNDKIYVAWYIRSYSNDSDV